jgi:phage/plasmid-like protein (TIGR03299 family)
MAHEVRQMAYVGQTPWHGLGESLDSCADLDTWKRAAGLDFHVNQAPVYFQTAERPLMTSLDGRVVNYRADTGEGLGVVSSSHYKLVQPGEIIDFYREFTATGGLKLNTAGALRGGRRIWALAELDSPIRVGDDVTKPYFLLTTGFGDETATVGVFTTTRVVCMNTMQIAMRQVDEETGKQGRLISGFSIGHHSKFNPKDAAKHAENLILAARQFEAQANLMAQCGISDEQMLSFFVDLFGKIQEKSGKLTPQSVRKVDELVRLYKQGPGADLKSAKGTAWGLLQSITRYADHVAPERTKGGRLMSAWYGTGKDDKARGLAKALELVG